MSRAKAIFLAALDREASQRDRFLVAVCSGDPELLDRVRGLIAAHDEADEHLPDDEEMARVRRIRGLSPDVARALRGELEERALVPRRPRDRGDGAEGEAAPRSGPTSEV